MNKIIAITHQAAGNDQIGTQWHETKVFGPDTTVLEVLEWGNNNIEYTGNSKVDVILTMAHGGDEVEK